VAIGCKRHSSFHALILTPVTVVNAGIKTSRDQGCDGDEDDVIMLLMLL